ncbi:MAG: CDP-glucose 4,6-dehydratase, partial [Bacteroidota bacterium]
SFHSTYSGKKVLVTGHTGFKGSWLCLWLAKLNADVLGISLETYGPESHFSLVHPQMISVLGDIRDKATVVDTFSSFQPEIVFHLAAQPLVRASYKDPSFTYETNVIGTLNVLEAARACGSVKAFINVTTDKVYKNLEREVDYTEEDRLGGYDPYSSSKACSEILTSSYRQSFCLEGEMLIASARAGNVIGGGDWSEDRLIPDLIRAALNGLKTEVRSPMATRPWQHVLDPLSGYMLLGAKLLEGRRDFCEGWNFGPSKVSNITVQEVLDRMQAQWDKISYRINEEEAKKYHEAKLLMLDCSKANEQLGWQPTWRIEETMKQTAKWYQAYCEEKQVISMQQLEEYLAAARESGTIWASPVAHVG